MALLTDKTILVTGVGPGLGQAVAQRCLDDGATVAIGARNAERVQAIANELDPSEERVVAVTVDIADEDSCAAAVSATVERFGQLSGIAQVAAFEAAMGKLEHADFASWEKSFQTNVVGTAQLVRAATPALSAAKGAVVAVGSQASHYPLIDSAGYAASKGGLVAAQRYLAKELGPKGIRMNTVTPSWMWGPGVEMYTQIVAKAEGTSPEEVKANIEASIPLRAITSYEQVADTIGFLLSDRASAITGQNVLVNGGEFMP